MSSTGVEENRLSSTPITTIPITPINYSPDLSSLVKTSSVSQRNP
ncbi:hypothetical protein [Photorhabdus viridis]